MRNLITATVVATSAFLANSAFATPVSEYQLVVDSCTVASSDPYGPPGSGCNAGTLSELADTTLAVTAGVGSYEYIQKYTSTVNSSTVDSGIADIVVAADGGMEQLYPNPLGSWLCLSDCDLKVSTAVDGPSLLEAVISINTGRSDLEFAGGSGHFGSDYFGVGGDFTGHFELVTEQAVPEPPTLPLVMTAFIAAFGLRKQMR